jgi:hypothetical protein
MSQEPHRVLKVNIGGYTYPYLERLEISSLGQGRGHSTSLQWLEVLGGS